MRHRFLRRWRFPWARKAQSGGGEYLTRYDYADPAIAPRAIWTSISVLGGLILLASGALFLAVLIRGHRSARVDPGVYRFSVAVHPPIALPFALNGFGLWITLMIALTLVNYGFPIAQLLALPNTSAPAIYVGGGP